MASFLSVLTSFEDTSSAGITFVNHGVVDTLSYADLCARTPQVAGQLSAVGATQGRPVVFQLTDNRAIVELFWGCAWLGAVPVIVPPALSAQDEARVAGALAMLSGALVLVDDRTASHVASDAAVLAADVRSLEAPAAPVPCEATGDTVRLIQMSSGSTGQPKGIVLDEETLMAAMAASVPARQDKLTNSMLTWLPLTHNFSLLGFHIYAMYRGYPTVLMATSDVIANPYTWFDAVTRYRPTITVCPNFGFVHVLRTLRLRGVPEGVTYDLSSIHKLISASEPIDAATARLFAQRMAPFGLRPNAIVAAYGMSESCLQITTTGIYEPLATVNLERSSVRIGASYDEIAREDGSEFVSVGKAVPGMEVSLRDDEGHALPDDVVGEIFIRGSSLTSESVTPAGRVAHALTEDGFFATGDIGLIHEGNLYVVARKKDVIFVNGKNYYSPDLEGLLMAELDQDSVVLGRTNPTTGEEEIVVFVPEDEETAQDADVVRTLAMRAGVSVGQVVRIGAIPRAANGKKMRRELEVLL